MPRSKCSLPKLHHGAKQPALDICLIGSKGLYYLIGTRLFLGLESQWLPEAVGRVFHSWVYGPRTLTVSSTDLAGTLARASPALGTVLSDSGASG